MTPAEQIITARLALTDSAADAYTVPAGHRAVVQSIVVANTDAEAIGVNIWTTDASDSDEPYQLINEAGVEAGDSLAFTERVHLQAGDKLRAQLTDDNTADLTAAVILFDEPA